jgi:acetyltransferase-like isoleucine patch superfamily enzyme
MLVKKERIPVLQLLFVGMLPSPLKKAYYRMKGYKIGKNVSISLGAVIIGKNVSIGDGVKIGFLTMIRSKDIDIRRFVKIGSMSVIDTEKLFIDDDARINEQVFIGGMKTPHSSLHLGKRTIIMQLSYLNPTLPIKIDDDSGVGGHCLFFTHGSWNNQLEGYPVKFAPITLGKKVWLPWRVFLMPGVTIGDNVVIGANSLISSDIPSNSLAAGAPAKVIRQDFPKRPDEQQKAEMLNTIYNDFIEYLVYCGISLEKIDNSGGFDININQQGNKSILKYSANNSIEAPSESNNALVVYEASEGQVSSYLSQGWKMVLSINNNLRIGSSDAGEEMATFFSRYGVRFSRLD